MRDHALQSSHKVSHDNSIEFNEPDEKKMDVEVIYI